MYICLNRATAGGSLAFEQFVQLAADAGFPGADVDLGWAVARSAGAMSDLFESRGLRFGGWGLPYDWRGQESLLDAGLRDLTDMAAVGSRLRIDSCCTWIMPSSDMPLSENWRFHVARLKPAARVLNEQGLRLGLEFIAPHDLRRYFKHEFIFTPGQMLELADEVGPNVGLLVDSFHCHTSGTPFEQLAKIPSSRIILVHINDVPVRPVHEIEDGNRLLPGEGALDLRAFVRALKQSGYAGPVSVEVFSEELNKLPPLHAARRACSATQQCLEGVNLE